MQGTGTAGEMALSDRQLLATEGIVICAIVVRRIKDGPLKAAGVRISTRAMWTKRGQLVDNLQKVETSSNGRTEVQQCRVCCHGVLAVDPGHQRTPFAWDGAHAVGSR